MKIFKIFIYSLTLFTIFSLSLFADSLNKNKEIVKDNISTKNIIKLAKSKLGNPYVYAKSGPDSFDCSGFVYYIYKENKIILPRTSLSQSQVGEKIALEELEKGDLVFFDTSLKGKVNHSGIYLGNGKFIHASSGKANSVTISDVYGWYKDKFKWGIKKNTLN